MNFKKLLVVAVAGAFALPFAAQVSAAGDNLILAQSSSSGGDAGAPASGASSTGTGPSGGVASPRTAGEPKAPTADRSSPSTGSTTSKRANRGSADFSAIDKNGDGMISRSEWDAYHRAGAASGGATTAPSGAAVAPAGRGKTGTTAGPGEASPRTAPSSDTATSGSTSGTGKAQ